MLTHRSYARITLALDIIRRLTVGSLAGYHELGIIKHQVDLYDTIAIVASPEMSVICDKSDVPTDSTNLCWQAAELLKKEHGISENVKITIQKNIPVKGGLAGGSTNAATVLLMLNQLWHLKLTKIQLMDLGRKIGMDVPFYFDGGTAFDTESTGRLEKIETDLKFNFILVWPDIGVSTKEAYQNIDYDQIARNVALTVSMKKGFKLGKKDLVIDNMHNDFEITVFKKYPQLHDIKLELLKLGCLNAVMSGSGSTMLGIPKNQKQAEEIRLKLQCRSIIANTL